MSADQTLNALNQSTERALDPNVLQRRASNPTSSVWVSASAGTGKTKVLTDRVLRLLLPQKNQHAQWVPGCSPQKILGLTFTKAAASEMALRINETLSEWAIAPEDTLHRKLKDLLGHEPGTLEKNAARKLFANVIDTPGRLKVMTIHAFCQSILSRFPLEAKLIPGFEVAEERIAESFIHQAKKQIFASSSHDKNNPTGQALSNLARIINEDQLNDLLAAIINERGQFEQTINKHFNIDGFYTALCQHLNIRPNQSKTQLILNACSDTQYDDTMLTQCADAMSKSGKTDAANAQKIYDFLAADEKKRAQKFNTYLSIFFTQKEEKRSKLIGKKISEQSPHLEKAMQDEAMRLESVIETIKAAEMAALTRDLFHVANEVLNHYATIKTQKNMLDYEDLIFKTRDLMKKRGDWVHYKLDQGIDHILIDEAQDTNPEQWAIIEALCEEFFSTHSQQDNHRTLFTVGDEKQSIYSFQRASPEEFDRMSQSFADKITAAKASWEKVGLNISFRSTKSVLNAVDSVFSKPETRKGLGVTNIDHQSFRRGQSGHVELWPLFENDESDTPSMTWSPPVTIEDQKSGSSKNAEAIAKQIEQWLKTKEQLPSYNRAIQPRDIMILVRTRNAFVNQIMRALKSRNIPVGGLDRIVLNDQLAVQDMLAAADFALLPSDDLTLACLLKSPLIGITEDQLFDLAYNRNTTLWQSVLDNADKDIIDYLKTLIKNAKRHSPYTFFAKLLQTQCPADQTSGLKAFQTRLGSDAKDSLNELLNACMNFEHQHIACLQSFIQWQKSAASDIKRQNDDKTNHVRIMTVHGSKGLQAPILFLPDTIGIAGLNASQPGNRILWPTQTGQKFPLWAPRKDFEPNAYKNAKDNVLSRMDEEYRRLLYVAMTRAEERLYISGHKSKKEIKDQCWYQLIKNGLNAHQDSIQCDDKKLTLTNPQTKPADREPKKQDAQSHKTKPTPSWLHQAAPMEPNPPAPLIPSRPSETEPSAASPLNTTDHYRFRRGNITHTLLQFLPDLPLDNRENAAKHFINENAKDLPENVRNNIVEEIQKILTHKDFSPIFAEGSRAEVPITGLLADNRLISGQIDRLLITDENILIIDFKTNRPPPKTADKVPQIYYNQLKSYADTLKSIYPNHKIKCALLWTDGPHLMPIEIN
ncbi:MAG: double-strand break repair helicase AddA [Bdellovibrionales bacterium]